jgi:hypothetical protein
LHPVFHRIVEFHKLLPTSETSGHMVIGHCYKENKMSSFYAFLSGSKTDRKNLGMSRYTATQLSLLVSILLGPQT